MGSSAPSTQTITQRTEIPAWLESVTKQNISIADQISRQPYQAYPGQLTAGFSPEQMAAFGYMTEGLGATTPAYNAAMAGAANASLYNPMGVTSGNFLQGNVEQYMNPYLDTVEKNALNAIEQQRLRATAQGQDQAIGAKSAFGSRLALTEANVAREAAKLAAETSAGIRSQGFNAAAQLMQEDQRRAMQAALANQQAGLQGAGINLQGASALGNVARQAQEGRQLDAALLENIGAQRQAMNQQMLDEAYARFLEARNYPIEMLNLRLGATSATPYSTTSTQTRPNTATGNSFLSGLGTVGTAATGIASLMKVLPVLFAGSDERMKTDVEKVGKDKETGVNIYAYRYKGDPKTYPKVVGPMAQEIEKKYPDQVVDVGGRKAVNLGFGPMQRAFK